MAMGNLEGFSILKGSFVDVKRRWPPRAGLGR